MNHADQEMEAKFYIKNRAALVERLQAAGARLVSARGYEKNLRFDASFGSLVREKRVLRLRQDQHAILTYKGPNRSGDVNLRTEIEVEVSDFNAARRLLEALGYEVVAMYEKYREVWALETVEVMIDELPYGLFAEIEGADLAAIQIAAGQLGLRWAARVPDSYLGLFGQLQAAGLAARNLSFEEVTLAPERLAALGVTAADAP